MLFMTSCRLRPHVTKSELKNLMDGYAKLGKAPGEVANYAPSRRVRRLEHRRRRHR
jgi:hypothetical protein